jgi:hypothetical protein
MSVLTTTQAAAAERRLAIGWLIWKDPNRIIETAAQLKEAGTTIECQLGGGSMAPAIPKDSSLRVQMADANIYRLGDIVAFARETGVCVHRVVHEGLSGRASGFLLTQGDGCFYPDPPVSFENILGMVTEFKYGDSWQVAGKSAPASSRIMTLPAKALRILTVAMLRMDVRLAQATARSFPAVFGFDKSQQKVGRID